MIEDSEKYLKNVAKRVSFYVSLKKRAINYITKNRIKDNDAVVSILLNSAMWGAHQLNETLTEHDLYDIIGLEQLTDNDISLIALNDEQKQMTLNQLLDHTARKFK
jgi:hypothetical protein